MYLECKNDIEIFYLLQIRDQTCSDELDQGNTNLPALSPMQAFKNEYQAAEAAERRRRAMKKKQQSCQTQ